MCSEPTAAEPLARAPPDACAATEGQLAQMRPAPLSALARTEYATMRPARNATPATPTASVCKNCCGQRITDNYTNYCGQRKCIELLRELLSKSSQGLGVNVHLQVNGCALIALECTDARPTGPTRPKHEPRTPHCPESELHSAGTSAYVVSQTISCPYDRRRGCLSRPVRIPAPSPLHPPPPPTTTTTTPTLPHNPPPTHV